MSDREWREQFKLHFGTDMSRIDSRALADSLTAITVALEQINNEMNTGKELTLKVKPFERGSFEVPFELIEACVAGVLASHASEILDMIRFLKQYISVKIELKGKKPKKEEKVGNNFNITTDSGNVVTIDTVTNLVLNNPTVNVAFERSMGSVARDEEINEVSIRDAQGQEIVTAKREELPYFEPPPRPESKEDRDMAVRAKIHVHKIVFDDKSKWGFIWDGNKNNANIKDADFQDNTRGGTRFGNGDALDVDLQVRQAYDEAADAYINKSYLITKVHKHIPRPRQTELGEGSE